MLSSQRRVDALGVCRALLYALLTVTALGLAYVTPAWAAGGMGEFGIETFESQILTENGAPATQAGSHPYKWTIAIVLTHHPSAEGMQPSGEVQNIHIDLPPGMIVNPTATTTRCSEAELEQKGECPNPSAVGEDTYKFGILGGLEGTSTVYNMETSPGEPAEIGFKAVFEGITVHVLGNVRTGNDYGLTGDVPDANQKVRFWANTITLYGKPEDAQKPFLTLPTSCGAPLITTITANSWQDPMVYLPEREVASHDSEGDPVPVTGCEKLSFTPRIAVQPTTHAADVPSGLNFEMTIPQEEVVPQKQEKIAHEESFTSLAEADLKDAVITLPAGMSVSPAAAEGLGACADTPEPAMDGEPERPGGEIELLSALPVKCPSSSKIGTIQVETPLLEQALEGSLYLAQQGTSPFPEGSNPFNSLVALYLVLEGKGVVLKLPGKVQLDIATGQLTTEFGEDPATTRSTGKPQFLPQIPFSHLKLDFFGGARAALVTPPTCGTYTVTSSLTPYSAPEGPPATPSSSFKINERCDGGQFNPSLVAGTEDNQAGAFSPLAVRLSRPEALEPEQDMDRIQVRMPPGLVGEVPSVMLCKEPQAEEGTCGQESLIGHVIAGVGAGPDPLYVTGEVFLTESYKGAPFGLSIVVPAVAGPFNLGVVNVRATVNVDPHTTALTVTTDPLPQILDGIPLQIRTVDVDVDRNHFISNPTNCAPMSIEATVASTFGMSAPVSSRFQVANCATLGFAPKFSATVSGHSSRVNGTSLDAKIAYPTSPQANIARAKFELPRQLPTRLKTLQKACSAAIFEANPASCSAASVVGIARAITPILPVVLSGPAYFVSHGGEAYPDLDIVLQGDGVRDDLVGSTFISKTKITSSTFKSVPDVLVSSFELYLPEGPDSVLTADGNLCKSVLKMPTTFVAQNGMEIHRSTSIAVSGCRKAKKGTKAAIVSKTSRDRQARGRASNEP